MSLQVEKLEKNMAKLTIEVSAEELEKAIEGAYQKNKNKISIPGFRKGKAPRKMIEQMYGKSVFYEDAANALIPDAYDKALEECEEQIVSSPKIDVTQLEAGKPFIFTAEVALKPEVTLGKYKGVKVDKIEVKVTDEEVDAEINRERESNARTINVEDRAVKDGDMTVIDFEGFVDGVAFEGGKGENHSLTIGSGSFIPGFEEGLIGAELNKETEVNVTFPEDYHAAELAGKPAVFKCTVKEIKEKQLPDLDDEFASEVSDFDTMAEYREDVQKKLTSKKEEEAKIAKEEAVLDAVIADAKMEIPDAMLETQQRQLLENFAQRIQAQGLSLEQYMQFTGLTAQTMMEQLKPEALKRIQSRLVLEAVAAAEKMEATEEDFEAEIKSIAESYQMEADKVRELLGEQGAKQVKEDICVRKAADFIVDNAKEAKAAAKKTTKKEKAAEEKPEEAVYNNNTGVVETMSSLLAGEGLKMVAVTGRAQLQELLRAQEIQLLLLDVELDGRGWGEGIEMIHDIRNMTTIPVIIISAQDAETAKIMALNAGADDYVTVGYNPLELLARVKSQLRRYTQLVNLCESIDSIYRVDGLEINDRNRTVTVDGREVKMTPIEYKILRLLVQERGKVLSISQIYESIWHMQAIGADNTIAVHIRHIREKIESNPKEPRYLKVVWGTGYKVG